MDAAEIARLVRSSSLGVCDVLSLLRFHLEAVVRTEREAESREHAEYPAWAYDR